MKQNNIIIGLLLLTLIFGCNKGKNTSFNIVSEDMAEVSSYGKLKNTQTNQQKINVDRKLIKDGSVSFETNDIKATRKQIFESVKKYDGYISSDQEDKYSYRISNTIVIRVPFKNFDLLLSDATKGVSKFDSKNIEVKDVTEEFLDVQARLKTKKELEKRYLQLLKKANKVTEILEVERQIGNLRSEIESIEGRLKYLENRVSLSTIRITFYQSIPDEKEGLFSTKFKNGFKKRVE